MSSRYIELFEDKAEQWRFRRKAANGETVLTSKAYTRKDDAYKAALREFPDDPIFDVDGEPTDWC